jgi:hypothetical protein
MTYVSPASGQGISADSPLDASRIFADILNRIGVAHAPDGGSPTLPDAASVASYTASLVRMLAPMFDVSDRDTIERAAVVVVCFDYFCRTVDRMADEGASSVERIHESTLVLMHGFTMASSLVPDASRLFAKVESYFQEASAGERYLWRHKAGPQAFSEFDFQMMGQKNAVMKSVPAILAGITGTWSSLNQFERIVQELSICIQMIDDLLDWEADLTNGYFSHVLSSAIAAAPSADVSDLRVALFSGGVAANMIDIALTHFNLAFQMLFRIGQADKLPGLSEANQFLVRAKTLLRSENLGVEIEGMLRKELHPVLNYGN